MDCSCWTASVLIARLLVCGRAHGRGSYNPLSCCHPSRASLLAQWPASSPEHLRYRRDCDASQGRSLVGRRAAGPPHFASGTCYLVCRARSRRADRVPRDCFLRIQALLSFLCASGDKAGLGPLDPRDLGCRVRCYLPQATSAIQHIARIPPGCLMHVVLFCWQLLDTQVDHLSRWEVRLLPGWNGRPKPAPVACGKSSHLPGSFSTSLPSAILSPFFRIMFYSILKRAFFPIRIPHRLSMGCLQICFYAGRHRCRRPHTSPHSQQGCRTPGRALLLDVTLNLLTVAMDLVINLRITCPKASFRGR